jgi:nucleotide-binding universal stress UspA family protein
MHGGLPAGIISGEESVELGDKRMTIFPTKILLATDGSREADLATTTAADLAENQNSELHVVYVEPTLPMIGQFADPGPERAEPESRQLLEERVERIRSAGGTVAEAHLRLGRPDDQIVWVAEEIGAGLIVIGSRGHGGVRRALMGSVSDSVVRHAHCPVLVVRE